MTLQIQQRDESNDALLTILERTLMIIKVLLKLLPCLSLVIAFSLPVLGAPADDDPADAAPLAKRVSPSSDAPQIKELIEAWCITGLAEEELNRLVDKFKRTLDGPIVNTLIDLGIQYAGNRHEDLPLTNFLQILGRIETDYSYSEGRAVRFVYSQFVSFFLDIRNPGPYLSVLASIFISNRCQEHISKQIICAALLFKSHIKTAHDFECLLGDAQNFVRAAHHTLTHADFSSGRMPTSILPPIPRDGWKDLFEEIFPSGDDEKSDTSPPPPPRGGATDRFIEVSSPPSAGTEEGETDRSPLLEGNPLQNDYTIRKSSEDSDEEFWEDVDSGASS